MKTNAIFLAASISMFIAGCATGLSNGKNKRTPDCNMNMDTVQEVTVDDNAKFVSNEIEIIINQPVSEVFKYLVYTPLEIQLRGTDDVPGVKSTKAINNKKVGENGYRKLICMEDGSSALEEIIENNPGTYFSNKVWNFTRKIAQNIEYAKGEWWFTPSADGNQTHCKWKYSYKLNDKKMFGRMGPVGRFIFSRFFIQSKWNDFMQTTLDKAKIDIEKANG